MHISSLPTDKLDDEVRALMDVFDTCFFGDYHTRLIAGDGEPIYLPIGQGADHARIVFAHGFFASALHEIAHWCVAGSERRQQEDFGYWYAPDGRSPAQQAAFEKVEVYPQALEWIFSRASARRFRISVDNLSGESTDPEPFMGAVHEKVLDLCARGLSERATDFCAALAQQFNPGWQLSSEQFSLDELYL